MSGKNDGEMQAGGKGERLNLGLSWIAPPSVSHFIGAP